MTRIERIFGHSRAVLPVVHCVDARQAAANTRVAFEAGADGVFLINHTPSGEELLEIYAAVRAEYPDEWIGINCLGWSPGGVFRAAPAGVSGVWADKAYIDEAPGPQDAARRILDEKRGAGFEGLYFGGVAFKVGPRVADPAFVARAAVPFMDVVTTSGPGTGMAAAVEKIRVMKEAIGDHPLGIASGVTPENVAAYLDHADCFLVATGISVNFETLDPRATERLVEAVRRRE